MRLIKAIRLDRREPRGLASLAQLRGADAVARGFEVVQAISSGWVSAMATRRAGDALVVGTLDRVARSLPATRDIADEPTVKGGSLSIVRISYDPADLVAIRSTLTGEHLAANVGA